MITFKQFLVQESLRRPTAEITRLAKAIANSGYTDSDRGMPTEVSYEIKDIADKFGMRELGSGFFGITFSGGKQPYVLKIYSPDDGYDSWVKFCLKHQHNPYIPKFKARPVQITGTRYKAIRMESLTRVRTGDGTYKKFMTDLIDAYDGLSKDKHLTEIAVFLKMFGSEDDLHDENIMLRGKQVVITDPLA